MLIIMIMKQKFLYNDFTVLEGDLPPRVLGYVIEWMTIYKEDLREIWETQQFRKLPPLV